MKPLMKHKLIFPLETKKLKKEVCGGLFYRGRVNHYINSNGAYIADVRMIPLRRKSCKGCERCGFLQDDLKESISCETFPIMDNIIDGAIYELRVTNESTDWETGHVDDYDLEFFKIEESK